MLIGVGIVLGLAILVPVIHHYQLRWAVEKYIAELKAKGEPMELAQVLPPPVPAAQNSTDIFRTAAALNNIFFTRILLSDVKTHWYYFRRYENYVSFYF